MAIRRLLGAHAAQFGQHQQLHDEVGRLLGPVRQAKHFLCQPCQAVRPRALGAGSRPSVSVHAGLRLTADVQLAGLQYLLQIFQRVLRIAVALEHQARLRDGAAQLGGMVDADGLGHFAETVGSLTARRRAGGVIGWSHGVALVGVISAVFAFAST